METKLAKFAVLTNPARFAVLTTPAKFAVDTKFIKLARTLTVPNEPLSVILLSCVNKVVTA